MVAAGRLRDVSSDSNRMVQSDQRTKLLSDDQSKRLGEIGWHDAGNI
jgi:hypothetical protein